MRLFEMLLIDVIPVAWQWFIYVELSSSKQREKGWVVRVYMY